MRRVKNDDLVGDVIILNVWASWCAGCRTEHSLVTALAEEEGMPVYGLNFKDEREDALRWLSYFGNPYAMTIVDSDGILGDDLDIDALPVTFVLDSSRRIRFSHSGALDKQIVSEHISPMLQLLKREQL